MLPIVEIPSVVRDHEKLFGFSGQIRKHFKEYLTGLIVSEKFTVRSINSMFINANDQSSMNRF
ncbi:MAG: IS701 family transposase, partial [Candidatus Aenigmatarchaeota archaeon]